MSSTFRPRALMGASTNARRSRYRNRDLGAGRCAAVSGSGTERDGAGEGRGIHTSGARHHRRARLRPDLVENPAQALGVFGDANPDHPYALIGLATVEASIEWFLQRFDDYDYTGSVDENFLLPTAIGSIKPSALVPGRWRGGPARRRRESSSSDSGNSRTSSPALAAENVANAKTPSGARCWRGACRSSRPRGGGRRDQARLRRGFRRSEFREAVVTQIAAHVDEGESVGFPAVLGVKDRARGMEGDAGGARSRPCSRSPASHPRFPVSGCMRSCSAQFRRAGGRWWSGGRGRWRRHRGDRVTVGLVRRRRVRPYEARLTSCSPPGVSDRAGSGWTPPGGCGERLRPAGCGGARPWARNASAPVPWTPPPRPGGDSVDGSLRPLDENGDAVYENLSLVVERLWGGRGVAREVG